MDIDDIILKERFAYKDLDIGQFFYNTVTNQYGIKLSSCRYFSLKHNHVFGFYGNQPNESDNKNYIKCDYGVWAL